ncbi:hypothetical protein HYDPIDRAFT_111259 [Hydnomerulius pinastri MD-312]|uniref:DUF6534 domain-containing protein n=1 Tax=Hydnomerulius pinastri MD-312 TaxID=994086 RepID=A0A0C9WG26_9AGAM|nr:hypothetical protein HYDPIDRAFT_111259 [Hydnomerulius pinastri MD-312]
MTAIGAEDINLGRSWGSTLAAVYISLVFYGISILQTFIYYVKYPNDNIYLKLLVLLVFLLDTVHAFLTCIGVWDYLVLHFGDLAYVELTHPPLLLSIIVTSLVSFTVQSFFVYRIWFLSKDRFKWTFPILLMPFVTAQPVIACCYTANAMVNTSVQAVSGPYLTKLANALNGTATAVDISITIALCTLLGMGRTGFNENTDRMLLRLIVISVNTGLCTAILAFLSVILLVISPNDLIFTGVYYPLCTVYCNTLLASLNVRSYARGGDSHEVYHLESVSSHSRYGSNRLSAPGNRFKSVDLRFQTLNIAGMQNSEENKNPGHSSVDV